MVCEQLRTLIYYIAISKTCKIRLRRMFTEKKHSPLSYALLYALKTPKK